ncbi:MAG: hypothetical protein A2W19_17200 [Spirochaetes bacterium RBG_16_49_21]|nr:MAG: hypothetical protein A2W19_17200 [Spirochaetes bacterium RBG_16_49_21]
MAENIPILVKTIKEYPADAVSEMLEKEKAIINEIGHDGIIKALELIPHPRNPALVLEDFPGSPLALTALPGRLDTSRFLRLALVLAENLAFIHEKKIVHNNVTPWAIFAAGPATSADGKIRVGISCFERSFRMAEAPEGGMPAPSRTSLAYLSPEGIGKLSCSSDARSDLYSLGGVLYELATGRPPFMADNASDLVYAHVSEKPEEPKRLKEDFPTAVSKIIMKLLEKSPDARYQSAGGLAADLKRCLDLPKKRIMTRSFSLGRYDTADQIRLPERLYEREEEFKILSSVYNGVCRGSNMLAMVTGHAGVGKSALVREFFEKTEQGKGRFVSGKFDQYRRNIPLTAFTEAFAGLMRRILTGSDEEISSWKTEILKALQPNAGVIVDLVPELEGIIGAQKPAPATDPMAAMNRLHRYLQKFVAVFADKDHPLIIFLDDLHWADSASLDLLKIFATSDDLYHVCIIGAYRDNEVGPGHPLAAMLETIVREKEIVTVNPKNISSEAAAMLIAETFDTTPARAGPLAHLVHAKTMGNPLFMREFLRAVSRNNLASRDRSGRWRCDFEGIRSLPASDNVIDLLTEKIKELSGDLRECAMTAACIGTAFSRNILAKACGMKENKARAALAGLAVEGMIVREGGLHRFCHDRIQEAAYLAMTREKRIEAHYRIGRILFENAVAGIDGVIDNIFAVVDQLNHASEIMDEHEKIELADLNYLAGKKAKGRAAFEMSRKYLTTAYGLLISASESPDGEEFPADTWERYYHLAYIVHLELAEAEYLNGNFDHVEEIVNEAVSYARNEIERAELWNILIIQLCMAGRYSDAIRIGADVLASMGINFDLRFPEKSVSEKYLHLKNQLEERGISFFINLPRLNDLKYLTAIRILRNMSVSALSGDGRFFYLPGLEIVKISLVHGNSPESLDGYLMLAMMIMYRDGNYALGFNIGRFAMTLADRYNNKSIICETYLKYANAIAVWKEPLKNIQDMNRAGLQAGLETGELKYTGDIYAHLVKNPYHQGKDLNQTYSDLSKAVIFVKKIKSRLIIDILEGMAFIIQSLKDSGPMNIYSFISDCEKHLHNCITNNSLPCYFEIHGFAAQVLYLFGEFRKACDYIKTGLKFLQYIITFYHTADMIFFQSLITTALHTEASEKEKNDLMSTLIENRQKLKLWSENCPESFLHKYLLVEAEAARISDRHVEAMDLYDQSIENARKNQFTQDEAIANELAGKFWLGMGKHNFAGLYLTRARDLYRRWGALCKARDCEERYGGLVGGTGTASLSGSDIKPFVSIAQEIISDVKLDRVLAKILTSAVKNTSAQKGFILIERDKNFLIEAEIRPNSRNVKVLHSARPRTTKLPLSIIQYVARTGEEVNLADATQDLLFRNDPYIVKNKPKSIYCLKNTAYMGKTVAIIYLENKIMAGAFAAIRPEIMNFMSSHSTIALENARLYKKQEETLAQLEESVRMRDRLLLQYEDSCNKNLQERMRPHFIHNALHTIHALVQIDPAKADAALMSFGEICRYYTDRSFESLVPLQEEWEFTRHYLDFERLRLKNRFTYTMKKAGGFSGVLVPPLILQPIAENSIKHGFKKKKGAGCITIRAARKKDAVTIEITDNGTGLRTKEPFARTLGNISARLRFHYRDSGVIIKNIRGPGVRVSIHITLDKADRL